MEKCLIIPPSRPPKYRKGPDTRDWSLGKLALYERYHQKQTGHKKHPHDKIWWVQVQLPHEKTPRWYQLPKDIQHAICFHHTEAEQNTITHHTLMGCLINVPISKYDDKGHVKLTSAKVISVAKKPTMGDPARITRSQFCKPEYNKASWLRYHKLFNFLRHDYDKQNRNRIRWAIFNLAPIFSTKG